jgi:dienelactone hydrolase
MGRRAGRVAVVALVAIVLAVAWEPSRVALQTLVLLPNLLDAGPKPLNLFSGPPVVTTLAYREADRGDLADLWLPPGASAESPVGAMLLVFGVNNLGREHPAVQRVADGLARSGVAVLVPDSATLLEGRLEIGEIDGVVRAFELLHGQPAVDRTRVGIVGFSVGGSLALVAARDARIAAAVRYVNAFGAYADAAEYLANVAAHEYELDGEPIAWLPTPLAREVFAGFMFEQVAAADDRAALQDAYQAPMLAGERPEPDDDLADGLGAEARAVYRLITAPSLDEARSAVQRLPAGALELIHAISPGRHRAGLEADVYVMHETDDHHVPYVHSRALAAMYEAEGLLRRHSEFRLFDHVQPDDLDLVAAAPELWKLLWHLHAVMLETL